MLLLAGEVREAHVDERRAVGGLHTALYLEPVEVGPEAIRADRFAELARPRNEATAEQLAAEAAAETPRAPRELCKDASFAPFPELEKMIR